MMSLTCVSPPGKHISLRYTCSGKHTSRSNTYHCDTATISLVPANSTPGRGWAITSFSFDTRRALETEISKWSLLVFVGFAVKPLILEHPSFFLQVRNNGGDPFPNTVKLGSLSKHDGDGSENVIWKCNFAFLQSIFSYSKSLCLKNVF